MDADLARSLFVYDPESGEISWRSDTPFTRAGSVIRTKFKSGYLVVKHKKKQYYQHRIAWLITHGNWPEGEIDHINHVRDDNRIANLRDVSKDFNLKRQCGQHNKKLTKGKSSKYKGVSFLRKAGKWVANARWNGSGNYLGLYATEEEAHRAYVSFYQERGIPSGCFGCDICSP